MLLKMTQYTKELQLISKEAQYSVDGVLYDSVLVFKGWYPSGHTTLWYEISDYYYAKDIGLVKRFLYNKYTNDTIKLWKLTEYFIND